MMSAEDTEGGRVCMHCGKAIADDDAEAMEMAEGGRAGTSWRRFIHAECVEAVSARLPIPEDEPQTIETRAAIMWLYEHGAVRAYGGWEQVIEAIDRGELEVPESVRAVASTVMATVKRDEGRES